MSFVFGCATRRDVTTIDSRLSEIELREAEERRRREEIAKAREANETGIAADVGLPAGADRRAAG